MGVVVSGWGEVGSTMRDTGLELAIKAAGGVASLARGIGIAQPSVSAWSRIPAERVLAVEALTQVNRFVLRPDLYGSSGDQVTSKPEIDEIDQLRAAEYGLLSLLLGKAPDAETLKRVATLKGDSSELGMAHVELASAAAATDDRAVNREFFDLFIGLGRGELLPYASYYLTGFLLEVMAGLERNDFEAEFAEQKRFFERHLKPWTARMFADLEMSPSARFYRAVGRAGLVFMELESEAFTLSE